MNDNGKWGIGNDDVDPLSDCWLNEDCIAGYHMGEIECRFPVYNADANKALQRAADKIIAELVCCDVYERLNQKPLRAWTDAERAEFRSHSLCYWGAASARIVWGEMT